MRAEDRTTGSLPWRIYYTLVLFTGGSWMLVGLVTFFVATEAARVTNDLWLTVWTTPPNATDGGFYPNTPPPFGATLDDFFLWMFFIFGLCYCVVAIVRNRASAERGAQDRAGDGWGGEREAGLADDKAGRGLGRGERGSGAG